jgi:diguanylate cyclase
VDRHTLSRTVATALDSKAFRRGGLPLVWALLAGVVAAEAVGDVLNPSGLQVEFVFHDWLHDVGGALAALLCLARVVANRHNRAAWGAIAAALVAFSTGQVLWSVLYRYLPPQPNGNVTDVFYLAFYPFAIAGLVLLIRDRVPRFEFHRWVDGIAIVLIVAAPGVSLVLVPVAARSTGDALADAVNFAYPLLDLLLVGAVLGVFALTNWRPGLSWTLLGLGFLLMAIPDSITSVHRLAGPYQGVHRPYHLESYDFLWTLGMVAIAYAAWARPSDRIPSDRPTGWRAIVLPLAASALALATQVYSYFHEIPAGGRPLTIAVVLLGMAQTYVARPRRGPIQEAERTAEAAEQIAPAEPVPAVDVDEGSRDARRPS